MNRKLVGTLLALTSATSYAFLPILAKLAYQVGIPPLEVSTWRFLVAVTTIWLLWPIWRRHADLKAISRPQAGRLVALGVLLAAVSMFGFIAVALIPASTYTLIFYTYPAMVALLSLAFGERVTPVSWAAVGMALVGCALTTGGHLVVNSPLGLTFVLLNAISYSAYLVLAGRETRHIPRLPAGTLIMSATLVTLLLGSLAYGLHVPQTAQGWLAVVGVGVVGTVIPILTMLGAMSYIGAPHASVVSTVEPAITVLLAAVLLHEQLEPLQLMGGSLILASVVLLNLPSRLPAEATSN